MAMCCCSFCVCIDFHVFFSQYATHTTVVFTSTVHPFGSPLCLVSCSPLAAPPAPDAGSNDARLLPIVQVLLGERGLSVDEFNAAFQRMTAAPLDKLVGRPLKQFFLSYPAHFALDGDLASARHFRVRNVRWPLPLAATAPTAAAPLSGGVAVPAVASRGSVGVCWLVAAERLR